MPIFGNKEDEAREGVSLEKIDKEGAETIVGPSVKVEGDFNSKGDIRIEGRVKGSVKTSKNLVVGQASEIEAMVKAENAVISGQVNGNIDVTGKLELAESARINGDIKAKVLSIAPGAVFTGSCQMDESKEQAPKSKAQKNGSKKAKTDANFEKEELVSVEK